jgi:hypothetical protein
VIYRLAAGTVALYILVMWYAGALGWQHVALPVFIWACLSERVGPRRFIQDWWPLCIFLLAYDSMRAWGWLLYPRVAVEQLFRWEESLFGAPDGTIWPFYFTRWLQRQAPDGRLQGLTSFCSAVYASYIFAVPLIMLVLWLSRSRLLFRRMLWAFTALNFMGLAIYILYPAAPPWWVFENGFARPTLEHSHPAGFGGSSTLATIFQYSANRFGAVPSLHAAHPFLLTLVLAMHNARYPWIWLSACYIACMWFACVFLNQHYIVDLLIGAALTPIALVFAKRPWGETGVGMR